MGQDRRTTFTPLVAILALFSSPACKIEETLLPTGLVGSSQTSGTGVTAGTTTGAGSITAPIIADPLPGTTVNDTQPSLSVLNSARQGGAAPTYLFQVSTETSFATLVAQSTEVPEGQGVTSWTVDRQLSSGRHFWRVRARSGTTDSSYSSTAEFTVSGSPAPTASPPPPAPPPTAPTPTAGTILSDPLVGGSVGEVNGGQFTSRGWKVTGNGDFIRYEIPPTGSGWVEFETTGLTETNPSHDQFMLFGMWDPSLGPYRANPYRVHLQKLHPNPHNPPYLRIRWIANGEQHDEGANFFAWEPSRTYRWRLEWGPAGGGNQARLLLDGAVTVTVNYSRAYKPNVHWIELGIGERAESVVGVTYSNFRVGN